MKQVTEKARGSPTTAQQERETVQLFYFRFIHAEQVKPRSGF